MLFDQITIVGVGLIGGSVGLAAKTRGVAGRVVGVGRDAAKLEKAVQLGAIDSFTTELASGVAEAALVVVCTPVDRIADTILEAAEACRPGTILTDAGSTKAKIVAAVDGHLPSGVEYVPAHPIAGSEKTGAEHAQANLFLCRLTILTPAPGTSRSAVEKVWSFWRALGSDVMSFWPEDHDRILASTSHLPHAVASGVAGVTPVEWMRFTAGGFRDTTRVAGGDPDLWAAIFQANRDAVLASLSQFTTRMDEFRRLLETGDADGLVRWLSEGKQVRDALGT